MEKCQTHIKWGICQIHNYKIGKYQLLSNFLSTQTTLLYNSPPPPKKASKNNNNNNKKMFKHEGYCILL